MLNSLYCIIPIKKRELVTAGIFLDHSLTTIPVDIINCLKNQFISHATSVLLEMLVFLQIFYPGFI